MQDREFSPTRVMEHVLSHWWIVLILTVLGGVIGWIFHLVQPPVYEATSSLTISMVFEERVLTEFEEYNAFGAAGAVVSSPDVVNAVYQSMQADGLSAAEINRLRKNMSTEYMLTTWEMHVRDRDPQVAVKYANIWADIAEQKLNDALSHVLVGEQLQNQINSLQSCLPSATPGLAATPVACATYSLDEINSELQGWSKDLASEQALSLGILPIMTISLSSTASVPTKPVLYGQASLVFAGMCIGFIISLWLVNFRKVQHRD